ncbi:MAG: hypothetical protein EHM53_11235 [Methanoregulaceae archaeon]|nr:MAG: hypothetical protein EHM53_11235 [Methanoregulaceae archaeon]
MSPDSSIPFPELAALADRLLEESDEDVERLAKKIGSLDAEMRNELMVSDLLNAWQVFYYYFRTVPDELVKERMELEPASSLPRGLKIDEVEFLELFFVMRDHKPLIVVSDGEKAVATFSGGNAYSDGMAYLENPEYSE